MSKYALTDLISEILGQPIRETRENALVRCPFHDDRHASLSIDLERGFWICFACGERGGIQSLAARLNKNVPTDGDLALHIYEGSIGALVEEPKDFSELATEYRRNLYRTRPDVVVEFLRERGLHASVLKHFGLGWDGTNIAFPYYDDEAVFGIKYRGPSGAKWSEPGSRRGIYNVNDVRFKPYVILCEGETDTLAVWSNLTQNFPTDIVSRIGVGGVPGVAGTRQTWETWALDLLWSKRVFVAYDADKAGDDGATLPLSVLGEKAIRVRPSFGKDMNEYLLRGGRLHDIDGMGDIFDYAERA